MKITILEYINESGNWEWYEIYQYSVMTPRDAIKQYLEGDELIDEEQLKRAVYIKKDKYLYVDIDENVRAIIYEI